MTKLQIKEALSNSTTVSEGIQNLVNTVSPEDKLKIKDSFTRHKLAKDAIQDLVNNADNYEKDTVGYYNENPDKIPQSPQVAIDQAEQERLSQEPKGFIGKIGNRISTAFKDTVDDVIVEPIKDMKNMIFNKENKQMLRGAARVPLGLGKVAEDIKNMTTEKKTSLFKSWIKDNEKVIADFEKENPNFLVNPDTVGDIATAIAGGMVTTSAKGIALAESLLGFTRGKGEGKGYTESLAQGAVEGAFAGLSTKIFKMFDKGALENLSPDLRKAISSKSPKQIEEYINTLNFAKEKDIELYDLLISGDLKKIQSSNLFGSKEIADLAENFEANELKALGKIVNLDNKTYDEIGEAFQSKAKDMREKFKMDEDILYGKAKNLAGDQKYDIQPLQNEIQQYLLDMGAPKSVVSKVKRELFTFENTALPLQKQYEKTLKTIKDKLDDLVGERQMLTDRKEIRLKEKEVSNLMGKYTKTKETIDRLKNTKFINADQIMNISKRINNNVFTPGNNSIGKSDNFSKKLALEAREKVDNYLKTIKGKDSEFWKTYSQAKNLSKERFAIFGTGDKGSVDFKEIGKILKTKDVGKLTEKIITEGSTFKLNKIKDLFGDDLAEDFVNKYINSSIKLVADKSLRNEKFIQVDAVNTKKFGKNLANLIKDPDNYNLIKKIYGDKAAKDLNSLSDIAQSFADNIEKLKTRTSELDRGIGKYIGENGLISGGLRVLVDALKWYSGGIGVPVGGGNKLKLTPWKGRWDKSWGKTKEMKKIMAVLKRIHNNGKPGFIERLRYLSPVLTTGNIDVGEKETYIQDN